MIFVGLVVAFSVEVEWKEVFFRNARAINLFFLYVFYVSVRRDVCFPAVKRTFSRAETYVFREENVENAGSLWKKCAGGANFSGRYLSCCL